MPTIKPIVIKLQLVIIKIIPIIAIRNQKDQHYENVCLATLTRNAVVFTKLEAIIVDVVRVVYLQLPITFRATLHYLVSKIRVSDVFEALVDAILVMENVAMAGTIEVPSDAQKTSYLGHLEGLPALDQIVLGGSIGLVSRAGVVRTVGKIAVGVLH